MLKLFLVILKFSYYRYTASFEVHHYLCSKLTDACHTTKHIYSN